ncbi:MAG: glycoside hydrolase family 2 protein [Pirellulaceae bacterium]
MRSRRLAYSLCLLTFVSCMALVAAEPNSPAIPLPEHPRPDFQRAAWLNLNGNWRFQFDPQDQGRNATWYENSDTFDQTISVPFPWGSPLSGVEDRADIGWYARSITVPKSWQGQRVFLVVGASDWHTTAWLNGHLLGEHQGGYTPFAFDLTPHVQFDVAQNLVLRVDDTPHPFKLEGKQGYGRAAGIWQTVYLEQRPATALDTVHFTPDVDGCQVIVDVKLDRPAPAEMTLKIRFQPQDLEAEVVTAKVPKAAEEVSLQVPLGTVRLWSLEDPYLYEVTAVLEGDDAVDQVSTYFGMRKISVGKLPGTDFPYVLLNDKPVYLQLALDQSYHPQGYYTFPSDAFMRDEILRTRQIGLNGQRIHIKVEVPRKLYWADRLGVLIMADVPNSWGPPDEAMRKETEVALRGMVQRDYNHPAIFSWVNFNETWGLRTGDQGYLPETQAWVEKMYHLTKQLDATRLVEDNSPCNFDHVATDINTWHAYLPGYEWRKTLDQICRDTHPGSTWNFTGGRTQASQPMFNSECGNVWGYEGSTGDVDWSWDYHIMMNEFRRHPKVCGWLYTEHHDVINEWNGYWRFDRSRKYTGMSDLARGMTLRDLHGAFYVAADREMCRTVEPGQRIEVPLFASLLSDAAVGTALTLDMELYGWNALGLRKRYWQGSQTIPAKPWMSGELEPLELTMPSEPALTVLTLTLRDGSDAILHRNFTTYLVADGPTARDETVTGDSGRQRLLRFGPATFHDASWSLKQWNVLDGLKVCGAGAGYFEYVIAIPEDLRKEDIAQATLRMELSAKQLFGKDREAGTERDGDFMRGKGTHDPSSNPNAYPMTDDDQFPSSVRVRVMGEVAGVFELPDDAADHRGILSWNAQKRDRHLREAGSYGYLVEATIPTQALERALDERQIVIRLEVDEALPGGVAVYGERFGRYPLDPTLIFVLKK